MDLQFRRAKPDVSLPQGKDCESSSKVNDIVEIAGNVDEREARVVVQRLFAEDGEAVEA